MPLAKICPGKAIEFILARGNLPILFWLKNDILNVPVDRERKNLCKYGSRIRILESQRSDGSWLRRKSGHGIHGEKTDLLIETLKNLHKLYDYGCSRKEERVQRSIDFLYSFQMKEGDFRGVHLTEYTPTLHALALEILCQFGLDEDQRMQNGFRWLLTHRQRDGGWAIPYRTLSKRQLKSHWQSTNRKRTRPIKPDKSKPFSHFVTGVVLRALAESPTWKESKETRKAGELLLSRFFKGDKYEDRQPPFFWEEISYPFWTTNILSSLDALSKIGFQADNEKIAQALE
ncbi:MAG: prenyltransferase/squalene oxidase repeat-containing protein, partial [Candidatus Aminicenantales bacterium]